MASATFTDLQTRLLHRISGYSGDVGLGPIGAGSMLGEFVNSALKQVVLEADWPWLIGVQASTTVAQQTTYSMPSDWLRTYSVVMTDVGDPLHVRTIGELDEVIYSGRPRIYTIDQEQLVMKPIPDGNYPYEHRYVSIENLLVNGADTPKIPVQFDEGVIEYGAFLGLRHLRQEDRAKEAMAGYERWLKAARDNKLRTREHPRVRVRPGSML